VARRARQVAGHCFASRATDLSRSVMDAAPERSASLAGLGPPSPYPATLFHTHRKTTLDRLRFCYYNDPDDQVRAKALSAVLNEAGKAADYPQHP